MREFHEMREKFRPMKLSRHSYLVVSLASGQSHLTVSWHIYQDWQLGNCATGVSWGWNYFLSLFINILPNQQNWWCFIEINVYETLYETTIETKISHLFPKLGCLKGTKISTPPSPNIRRSGVFRTDYDCVEKILLPLIIKHWNSIWITKYVII